MENFKEMSSTELQQTNGGFVGLVYLAVKGVAYVAASTAVRTAVVKTIGYVGAGMTVGGVAAFIANKADGK